MSDDIIQLKSTTELNDLPGNRFSVDYAVRGTAKCKVCKKLINRNDLRISKRAPFKSKHIKQFYHLLRLQVIRESKNPSNVISDSSELDGFVLISSTGKLRINDLLSNVPASRLPSVAPIENTGIKVASIRQSQTKLVPTSLPSVNIMFTNADQRTPSKLVELKRRIQKDKPLIVTVCEMKPKNSKDRTLLDYKIPGYTIHSVNPVSDIG